MQAGSQRSGGLFKDEWMRREDNRAVLAGLVPLYTRTSSRILVVTLPGQPKLLFQLGLSATPKASTDYGAWQRVSYLDDYEAGQPAAAAECGRDFRNPFQGAGLDASMTENETTPNPAFPLAVGALFALGAAYLGWQAGLGVYSAIYEYLRNSGGELALESKRMLAMFRYCGWFAGAAVSARSCSGAGIAPARSIRRCSASRSNASPCWRSPARARRISAISLSMAPRSRRWC